jgi:hypothetical protein
LFCLISAFRFHYGTDTDDFASKKIADVQGRLFSQRGCAAPFDVLLGRCQDAAKRWWGQGKNRSTAMRYSTLLVMVAAMASCHYASPDLVFVPDNPGYQEDVHPLFSDHCLVCHGYPASRDAPKNFRLDVYDKTDGIPGAYLYGDLALDYIKNKSMPPGAKDGEVVGPNGILMLQRWVDNGKPQTRP